ncbi:MAG: hypothetical protein KDI13_07285 [Alphaproteobacteria bacterium]|nr:hypothetical protein [Alphaproteobacteria bacterium]
MANLATDTLRDLHTGQAAIFDGIVPTQRLNIAFGNSASLESIAMGLKYDGPKLG